MMALAWPLIVASSFWSLQMSIDRFFLGHYDLNALAAVTGVVGVFWAPMALIHQTVSYLATFVAQYIGANEKEKIGCATWQSIYIAVIGGLLFLLHIPFAEMIFDFFNHSDALKPLEVEYFTFICFSALPTALVAAASGFFTGLEKTKTVMWINAVGLVANFLFDYLFIFGNLGFPEMGIRGAALGTTFANFCAAIFGFYLLFKSENEEAYNIRSHFRLDFKMFKQFLYFGIPNGLQWALEGLAFTAFLIIVGRMPNGEAALASSGILVTLLMLGILPAMGMGQAVLVEVGTNIGKKNIPGAERRVSIGLQLTWIYGLLMGLLLLFFSEPIVGLFASDQGAALWVEIFKQLEILVPLLAVFLIFDATQLILNFAVKGAGDTRFPSFVSLIAPWPIFVLPTWLLADLDTGIYWAWGAGVLYVFALAVIFALRYKYGPWRTMKVI
jgi:MATE family multidrug resistance protein